MVSILLILFMDLERFWNGFGTVLEWFIGDWVIFLTVYCIWNGLMTVSDIWNGFGMD